MTSCRRLRRGKLRCFPCTERWMREARATSGGRLERLPPSPPTGQALNVCNPILRMLSSYTPLYITVSAHTHTSSPYTETESQTFPPLSPSQKGASSRSPTAGSLARRRLCPPLLRFSHTSQIAARACKNAHLELITETGAPKRANRGTPHSRSKWGTELIVAVHRCSRTGTYTMLRKVRGRERRRDRDAALLTLGRSRACSRRRTKASGRACGCATRRQQAMTGGEPDANKATHVS